MTGWWREFRILPVVLIATASLLALKTFGLIFDGGFTLGQRLGRETITVTTVPAAPVIELRSPAQPLAIATGATAKQPSWMQEMFQYPGSSGRGDITGSVGTTKPAEKKAAEEADAKKEQPKDPPPDKGGTVVPVDQPRAPSTAERALLERLQERRQELDARARELDMREGMLKAAEKKGESGASNGGDAKDGGDPKSPSEAQRKQEENTRFKALVVMYETMKPKDAAKIFDRLDVKVVVDMAVQIKPQRMAEILASMSPEAAEKLTIELASKSGGSLNPASLPKIDGKPGGT